MQVGSRKEKKLPVQLQLQTQAFPRRRTLHIPGHMDRPHLYVITQSCHQVPFASQTKIVYKVLYKKDTSIAENWTRDNVNKSGVEIVTHWRNQRFSYCRHTFFFFFSQKTWNTEQGDNTEGVFSYQVDFIFTLFSGRGCKQVRGLWWVVLEIISFYVMSVGQNSITQKKNCSCYLYLLR